MAARGLLVYLVTQSFSSKLKLVSLFFYVPVTKPSRGQSYYDGRKGQSERTVLKWRLGLLGGPTKCWTRNSSQGGSVFLFFDSLI